MQCPHLAPLVRATAVVLAFVPVLAAAADDIPAAPAPIEAVTAGSLAPAAVSDALPPTIEPAPAADEPVPGAPPPADLWERIRRGYAMPDLTTKAAISRTQWYAGKRKHIERVAQRAGLYLYHIVEEIERRGMPTELALLPFIESAMQPEALSPAQAAGLWQFIPSTGKLYSLEQNLWRDERRDVIASTRAALDYLQNLYAQFGDWQLALAAYNMGEWGLARAIERAQRAGKPTDYSSLKLPNETTGYVPNLQAIKNIIGDPARYGVELPAIANEPYFVTLTKNRDIDVATAARLAQMPLEEFRALNPSFNRPLIVGAAQPTILLPAANAETYLANLAAWEASGQPLASWTAYTLEPGESLEQIAKRVGLAEAALREANRVPSRYRLAAGSTILVPRDHASDGDIAAEQLAAAFKLIPVQSNLQKMSYRVQRGDTLQKVAQRHRVDPDDIVDWNRLSSRELQVGQKLTLTVARAPAARTAKAPAGRTLKSTAARSTSPKKAKAAAKSQRASLASTTRH
jgi:membrane-bound lytic murein transglycosylase D